MLTFELCERLFSSTVCLLTGKLDCLRQLTIIAGARLPGPVADELTLADNVSPIPLPSFPTPNGPSSNKISYLWLEKLEIAERVMIMAHLPKDENSHVQG